MKTYVSPEMVVERIATADIVTVSFGGDSGTAGEVSLASYFGGGATATGFEDDGFGA